MEKNLSFPKGDVHTNLAEGRYSTFIEYGGSVRKIFVDHYYNRDSKVRRVHIFGKGMLIGTIYSSDRKHDRCVHLMCSDLGLEDVIEIAKKLDVLPEKLEVL